MLNFGFERLRLVNPRADHLSKGARDMAVKEAKDVLRQASLHKTLAEAVADCHQVLGTSRRLGKYRNNWHRPSQLNNLRSAMGEEQQLALVFGREDHGLSTAELELCTAFITIPSSERFPSLNLAQAVGICLYELATEAEARPTSPQNLAPRQQIEAMVQHMRRSLSSCGYLDSQNPDHILRTYRQIFNRAGLDEREVRILHGLWSKIDWLMDRKE